MIDLERIAQAELQRDPFDHLVVPGCVANADLERINADYPGIERPGNLSLDELRYGPAFDALVRELQSPALAAALGEKFGMELAGSPTTITVRKYCEQSDGNIHTDHPSKVLTVLLYFNTGWDRNEGRLRLLRSQENIEDYAAEIAPVGGTLLAFRRTADSWHGHKPFVGERRMLQVNFLRHDALSRLRQRVDRFGTRIGKRVLRLVRGAELRP
jgi:SM-20-related protein